MSETFQALDLEGVGERLVFNRVVFVLRHKVLLVDLHVEVFVLQPCIDRFGALTNRCAWDILTKLVELILARLEDDATDAPVLGQIWLPL